jgi:hypothetical protein
MIHTDQIDQAWEQGPVTIRPLRSLTQQAFDAVREAIGGMPGNWTLERHDDYEGYLSILISPESEADVPSFLISGQVGLMEVAKFQGDELHTLGRFESLEATIAELVRALTLSLPK